MERNSKNERGITLIALIITIIVMLILVAVSISIALNTGLFESAGKATGDWGAVQEQEQELASGKVNIGGVWYESIDEYVNEEKTEEIDWDEILADANVNPDKYLQQAAELGQNIEENTAIGIGTNGKVVNMDLWVYNPMYFVCDQSTRFGTGYSLTAGWSDQGMWMFEEEPGYIGESFDDIIIPQYIKASDDLDFREVNGLFFTFFGCANLINAPDIPETVTSAWKTFEGCTSLEKGPMIPSNIDLGSMDEMFLGCINLKDVVEIPNSIETMIRTFSGCTSLTGTIKIKSKSIENIAGIFDGITNELTVLVPANSTTYDTFYEAYGDSENITIETY